MHWKLERDRFYKDIFQKFGLKRVLEAGFLFDRSETPQNLDDVNCLCTPTSKLTPIANQSKPVVLLSTGAFSPIHDGHIQMMETAKQHLEELGYGVIGGYISPSHDAYLAEKLGENRMPPSYRIDCANQAVSLSKWLMVDPWEALYRQEAINFTDVIERLTKYLRFHLSVPVNVIYVCGGDNARFALTFVLRGECVIVSRPGHEKSFLHYQRHGALRDLSRIHWVNGVSSASSTEIRERQNTLTVAPSQYQNLHVRLEDEYAFTDFGLGQHGWKMFQLKLMDSFAQYITGKLTTVCLPEQRLLFGQLQQPVISLDPLNEGEYNLKLSRIFDIGGYHLLGYTNRIGSPTLELQVSSIPMQGQYILFDDDIATGGTIEFALRLLTQHTVTVKTFTSGHAFDIADSRDFLLGGGGLLVKLPNGKVGRAPYVMPYVDPSIRCNISSADILRFSIEIWQLNRQIFEPYQLRVKDLPLPTRTTILTAGFDAESQLTQVCEKHIQMLGGPPKQ